MKQDDNEINFMDETSGMDEAVWELLSLYLDGETDPDETAQVKALLASDARYAREFSLMKRGSTLMQAAPEFEPPARLREAIFAKTISRPTFAQRVREVVSGRTQRPALLWLTGATAVTALAFVLLRPVAPTSNVAEISPRNSVATSRVSPSVTEKPELSATNVPAEEDKTDLTTLLSKMEQETNAGQGAATKPETVTASKVKPILATAKFEAESPVETKTGEKANPVAKPSDPKMLTVRTSPRIELVSVKTSPPNIPVFPRTQSRHANEGFYSKKPMMDVENQRPVQASVIQVADSRTSDDGTTDTMSESGKVASAVPDAPMKRTMVAGTSVHVPTLSDLKTNEAMRREEMSRNGGYGAITREGIQSQQIRVGFTAKL